MDIYQSIELYLYLPKKLYHINKKFNCRINYDGTLKTVITRNVTHSMGLEFFENSLYYLSSGGTMHKLKLYGTGTEDSFKLDIFNDGLFSISQRSVQPNGINNCANHTCSYLCLPSKTHYRCLCEDGMVIKEEEKCHSLAVSSFIAIKINKIIEEGYQTLRKWVSLKKHILVHIIDPYSIISHPLNFKFTLKFQHYIL